MNTQTYVDLHVHTVCVYTIYYYYSHYSDDVDAITVTVGDTNGKVKVYTCLG